jgi:hypothetical protein
VMLLVATQVAFHWAPKNYEWVTWCAYLSRPYLEIVANMASYAISSSLILVIYDSMIIGSNHIVLACLCRHF